MESEVFAQTEAMILSSHLFRSKPQMKRLLRYLIKHTLANNKKALQQRSIAVACLGRDKHFDSAKDPIVRIEAARLRKLLDRYYDNENSKPPPYRISLPKGSYQLRFSRSLENKISSGLGVLLICQSPKFASETSLQLMLRLRRDLCQKLTCFRHIKLTVDFSPSGQVAERGAIHFLAEEQHDYILRMEVVENLNDGGYLLSTIAVHRVSQEILWSQSTALQDSYSNDDLNQFYKRLISPLFAETFGLLGRHWAHSLLVSGIEYAPDHQVSYAYYLAISNEPTLERCQQYLDFLEGRLERQPEDYVAKASYLALGFFDYFLGYQLMQDSVEVRLQHALKVSSYYPNDAGVLVLLGVSYFLTGDFAKAKVHLKLSHRLNPDHSQWRFIHGSLLYFMGEKESGLKMIEALRQYSESLPTYYNIPAFFDSLERGDNEQAYCLGSRVHNLDDLGHLVRSLAYYVVGSEQQASIDFARITRHETIDVLISQLLHNHPTLLARVVVLIQCLRAIKPPNTVA